MKITVMENSENHLYADSGERSADNVHKTSQNMEYLDMSRSAMLSNTTSARK
jgi:hypothetical protein